MIKIICTNWALTVFGIECFVLFNPRKMLDILQLIVEAFLIFIKKNKQILLISNSGAIFLDNSKKCPQFGMNEKNSNDNRIRNKKGNKLSFLFNMEKLNFKKLNLDVDVSYFINTQRVTFFMERKKSFSLEELE